MRRNGLWILLVVGLTAIQAAGAADQEVCGWARPKRHAEKLYGQGLRAGCAGRVDRAAERLTAALAVDPFHIPARRALDLIADVRSGRAQDATARALFRAIDTAERDGWLSALPHIDEAAKLQPGYYYVRHERAAALFELGRYKESLAEIDLALSDRSDYTFTHNNLGLLLDRLGRNEEALVAYRRAIACDPAHYKAYKNIGVGLRYLGSRDEGQAWIERSLEVNPTYVFGYEQLTTSAEEMEKWMANLKPLTTAELVCHLLSRTWREQRAAARLLMDRKDPQGEPALIALLDHESALTRFLAIEGLSVLASDSATRAIARRLQDVDNTVRRRAIEALGRIASPAACKALTKSYRIETGDLLRSSYANALVNGDCPESFSALLSGAQDESPFGKIETKRSAASLMRTSPTRSCTATATIRAPGASETRPVARPCGG
ncbi:MAG: tetratricopeptide repeat protein [Vicinamibacteria bacterium]|nr:tetratricopeptide repeat protein [Vicinamibacteria bacterium]